jgi:hypothetical protein
LAENPLVTLVRLLGGTVLLQGRLGHQILGELLITNTNEVAMAVAGVVIAGTSGQRSAVGQIALRTVVPAVAVRTLLDKQEKRIDRKRQLLEEQEREVEQLQRQRCNDIVSERESELERRWIDCVTANRRLAKERRDLLKQLRQAESPARRGPKARRRSEKH